ncbi:hypothetical protein [Desulfopila sp. IMCC35008]|uniref:hypothetical protein n=1 Tax=Desulfopila sp. IMCC35008 TaxID=2653858 RepID=UPI0027145CD4|nr:hypothetical protein [Desulfopila sp. IMCC35008]
MNTITAILVIISAIMHSSWNVLSKSASPTIGFFQLTTLGTILWFSPVLYFTADLMSGMSLTLWAILLIAGLFQAIYYIGLACAYARGALSIAYPLARSFPLLIVTALTFMVGRGSEISYLALAGISVIIVGALILPMKTIRDLRFENYLNASCAFALIAALGTAGYSFVDDIGMNLLKRVPDEASGWMRALLYLVLECVFTAFWLQLLMMTSRTSMDHFRTNWRSLLKPALLAGLAIGATYGIILLAMTHAQNISYVVGLRQLSIPLGAIMGVFILKEKASYPRFIGITILFIGLILVSLG